MTSCVSVQSREARHMYSFILRGRKSAALVALPTNTGSTGRHGSSVLPWPILRVQECRAAWPPCRAR